jgi:hypothetical protein
LECRQQGLTPDSGIFQVICEWFMSDQVSETVKLKECCFLDNQIYNDMAQILMPRKQSSRSNEEPKNVKNNVSQW